jgi:tetraacyldisaccharide 4'-kinase
MTWGNPESPKERIISTLLQPASAVYGLGSYLRLRGYGGGLLERHRVSVPVISVGNLTCGGTGKTPVTIDLARRLTDSGLNVAIVSRGYRRKSREELLVVSDGNGSLVSCADAGDEPYMMALAVPKAKVIVSSKRSVAADVAVNVYDADVIVLDDGFQHLAIERDHDIVLLDYNDDPVGDSLLPAGRLREPISALTRASWVVVTKVPPHPKSARLSYFEEIIRERAQRANITSCRFVPHRLRQFGAADATDSLSTLKGVKVIALCGIARPRPFVDLVTELGADVLKLRAFPDHHWWSAADMNSLGRELARSGADLILTTEKDAARLDPELCRNLPLHFIELRTQWLGPVPVLSAPPFVEKIGNEESSLADHPEGAGAR